MIGERIKQLRGEEAQEAFGARFGVTRNTVRRYEAGANPPDTIFVYKLCRAYKINANWLITGEGQQYLQPGDQGDSLQSARPETTPATAAGRRRQDPSMPGDALGLGECVELLAKIYNSGNTVLIRAIAANLHAFSEAVDNKALAQKAIDMMEEMNKRILTLEQDLGRLKEENEKFLKDPPGKEQQATG